MLLLLDTLAVSFLADETALSISLCSTVLINFLSLLLLTGIASTAISNPVSINVSKKSLSCLLFFFLVDFLVDFLLPPNNTPISSPDIFPKSPNKGIPIEEVKEFIAFLVKFLLISFPIPSKIPVKTDFSGALTTLPRSERAFSIPSKSCCPICSPLLEDKLMSCLLRLSSF